MMGGYYLGVDIGGSKSHALLADAQGNALAFGETGPGSHEVVGYEGLEVVLQEITCQVLDKAGIHREEIVAAGFGVAGYDWPDELPLHLEKIATLGLKGPVEVVNDAIVGLVAGASQGWGVAVVSGTGGNCWGWDQNHRVGRVTGCGMVFGEYGGGWDLVVRALQAVGMAWTRRGEPTRLTQVFVEQAGASSVEDLLEGLTLGKYHFEASLAQLVFRVAEEGDRVAQECIRWVGRELGSLANGVIRQLDIADLEFEVVQVGSLYLGGPLLNDAMQETIQALAPRARLVLLETPPVVGGVLLAMQADGLATPELREKLICSVRENRLNILYRDSE